MDDNLIITMNKPLVHYVAEKPRKLKCLRGFDNDYEL